MRVPRASAVALIAIAVVVGAPSSTRAGETATSSDGNDVAHRLDLRSVVIAETSGDLTRITVRFWERVPTWMIRGNGLWVETDFYRYRIYRNADGQLRIRGGDLASACCDAFPARHPNPRTFVGRHWVYGVMPPPDELRATTFRKPDCSGPCRWFEQGNPIDRTPWAPI